MQRLSPGNLTLICTCLYSFLLFLIMQLLHSNYTNYFHEKNNIRIAFRIIFSKMINDSGCLFWSVQLVTPYKGLTIKGWLPSSIYQGWHPKIEVLKYTYSNTSPLEILAIMHFQAAPNAIMQLNRRSQHQTARQFYVTQQQMLCRPPCNLCTTV